MVDYVVVVCTHRDSGRRDDLCVHDAPDSASREVEICEGPDGLECWAKNDGWDDTVQVANSAQPEALPRVVQRTWKGRILASPSRGIPMRPSRRKSCSPLDSKGQHARSWAGRSGAAERTVDTIVGRIRSKMKRSGIKATHMTGFVVVAASSQVKGDQSFEVRV